MTYKLGIETEDKQTRRQDWRDRMGILKGINNHLNKEVKELKALITNS